MNAAQAGLQETVILKRRTSPPLLIFTTALLSVFSLICNAQSPSLDRIGETNTTNTDSLAPLPALTKGVLDVNAYTSDVNLTDTVALDTISDVVTTTPLMKALRASDWTELGYTGGWSLQSVLQLAASANPNWGTYAANHAEAHAELIRASAFPNPEVEVELGRSTALFSEEGSKPTRGTYDLSFSQPIEMPGKRAARKAEAQAGFAVVSGQIMEYNAMLRADVLETYYTVQYYRALERLQKNLLQVAAQLVELAKLRVELGDAGRIELVNADVERLKTERDAKVAERRRLGAQAALDALVGGKLGKGFKLSDPLIKAPPRLSLEESVRAAVALHPRLVRLAAELEQRYASLDRERTDWWPDLKLGLRKSKDFESAGTAISAGVEIPLWNRNEGGIAKAEAQAQKTYNDIMIALNELRRDVETGYYSYEAARDQIASYNEGLKEGAQEATKLAFIQYQAGAASYSDVLVARRALQETQQGYLQAIFDAATARAKLDLARGEVIRCPEIQPQKKQSTHSRMSKSGSIQR